MSSLLDALTRAAYRAPCSSAVRSSYKRDHAWASLSMYLGLSCMPLCTISNHRKQTLFPQLKISQLCLVQSTKFMLGIIIAVICSNWVGEAINSDGVYETDLEADGTVIFLRPSPPHTLYTKTAADIAARAVWYIPVFTSVFPKMFSTT